MARLLIIDDDTMITGLLHEHFSSEGYEVVVKHMAEEGFAQAQKTPPDLILLDVNLPDATGFQMVWRFRKECDVTKETPIILMSGAARHPSQRLIGKQMGADDYIL